MANAALSGSQGLNTATEAVRQPNVFPSFMRALGAFLRGPLQSLNDRIEAGTAKIADFLGAWEPAGNLMRRIVPLIPHMGERQGRDVLAQLAFVPTSIEYHAQRSGQAPGDGLK